MPVLEERVSTLETALERFIVNTDRAVAEIRASNARTDSLLLKMQQQADRDRAQMEKNRAEAREQADRDRAQMEKNREQADRERKDFNLRLAGISDRMGTLVEDMVAPNIERIARQIFPGEEFVASSLRNKRQHPNKRGHNMEVDLLVAGTRHVLVCEAKSKLNKEKTDEFLEHLRQFPEFFPEYAAHKLVPVMASIRIDPRAIAYLNRQKVYGLAFADGTMEVVNAGQF